MPWTEQHEGIASRASSTDLAGFEICRRVGEDGDSVSGCRPRLRGRLGVRDERNGRTRPDLTVVIDRFHAVGLENRAVDDVRRRVQQEALGHRGRTGDPLYAIRRLLLG